MNRRAAVALVVAALLGVPSFSVLSGSAAGQEETAVAETAVAETAVAEIGKPAPEIRVADGVAGCIGGDGRTRLADFRGEVVLLWFFRTHCGASRAEMRPLARLHREQGRRGLVVLGLTGDDRATLLRYLAHVDASFPGPLATGAGPGYPARTLPFAALVGADGTLLWQGASGSLPDETLEQALRAARKLTPEQQESRAASALAAAETLLADRQFARAERLLRAAAEKYEATASGRRAAERLKTLEGDDVRAEVEAQRDLAKLLGGIERPAEADGKRAQKLAKTLEKRAAEWKESAPRASALAAEWASVCAEPWK